MGMATSDKAELPGKTIDSTVETTMAHIDPKAIKYLVMAIISP
jgi:hypothetical protein